MRKPSRRLRAPAAAVVLFAAAAVLLLTATIGGARAALEYFSQYYTVRVRMHSIGVTLNENGAAVSRRDYGDAADGSWVGTEGELLTQMLADAGDECLKLGKAYPEALSATNSGQIDEYVRVVIRRYWMRDGEKLTELDPGLIELHFPEGSGWVQDPEAATPERTVLYYTRVLPATDENGELLAADDPRRTAPALSDTLTVNGGALTAATTETVSEETRDGRTYRTVTTTYDYDGVTFVVEAEADAVQTHSAEQAIRSVWGRRVTITDGVLSLD